MSVRNIYHHHWIQEQRLVFKETNNQKELFAREEEEKKEYTDPDEALNTIQKKVDQQSIKGLREIIELHKPITHRRFKNIMPIKLGTLGEKPMGITKEGQTEAIIYNKVVAERKINSNQFKTEFDNINDKVKRRWYNIFNDILTCLNNFELIK